MAAGVCGRHNVQVTKPACASTSFRPCCWQRTTYACRAPWPHRRRFPLDIIPARVANLAEKLAANADVPLVVAVKFSETDKGVKLPSDVYVAGPNWLLHAPEADGQFPLYRDIVARETIESTDTPCEDGAENVTSE